MYTYIVQQLQLLKQLVIRVAAIPSTSILLAFVINYADVIESGCTAHMPTCTKKSEAAPSTSNLYLFVFSAYELAKRQSALTEQTTAQSTLKIFCKSRKMLCRFGANVGDPLINTSSIIRITF